MIQLVCLNHGIQYVWLSFCFHFNFFLKYDTECADGLVVKTIATSLSTALRVVRLNPIWTNTLCDPQIVFLSLGVLCIRFWYICNDPRDTGIYITNTVVKKKWKIYFLSDLCPWFLRRMVWWLVPKTYWTNLFEKWQRIFFSKRFFWN